MWNYSLTILPISPISAEFSFLIVYFKKKKTISKKKKTMENAISRSYLLPLAPTICNDECTPF